MQSLRNYFPPHLVAHDAYLFNTISKFHEIPEKNQKKKNEKKSKKPKMFQKKKDEQ